jgi:uncharacterized cupin superfamily protein
MTATRSPLIVSGDTIRERLEEKSHPLDAKATRRAVSLGDLTGLTRLGVHFTVLRPGEVSSVRHRHRISDEFVFVLEGSATLRLDDATHRIGAGDFVGLPARGASHVIHNDGTSDFVYLVAGNREAFDVVEYPELQKRAFAYSDGDTRRREVVDEADIEKV